VGARFIQLLHIRPSHCKHSVQTAIALGLKCVLCSQVNSIHLGSIYKFGIFVEWERFFSHEIYKLKFHLRWAWLASFNQPLGCWSCWPVQGLIVYRAYQSEGHLNASISQPSEAWCLFVAAANGCNTDFSLDTIEVCVEWSQKGWDTSCTASSVPHFLSDAIF